MKSLIVYDTKHGTSREVAERIARAIREQGAEAELLELGSAGAGQRSVAGYDAVAIGAPFYMGQWSRKAVAFATSREAELAGKKLALFAVGANPELGVAAAKAALPAALADEIVASAYMGGRVRMKELGLFERIITRMVSGKSEDSSSLDLAAAESLGRSIAGLAG
jgi:Flavodoxin